MTILTSSVLSLRAAGTYRTVKAKLPGAEGIFKHVFPKKAAANRMNSLSTAVLSS